MSNSNLKNPDAKTLTGIYSALERTRP